jgi:hypothetical protein
MMEPYLVRYYLAQGPFTDPRDEVGFYEGLPPDVASLRDVVQGLLIHPFWAQRYGVQLTEDREGELELRSVPEKLRQIRKLYDAPLTKQRPPSLRLVGNCRDYSVLLCSMLRHQGVPARARCGFATYFAPNHFEDHWVCEYRNDEGRWVMVDAQLDEVQRIRLGVRFDALDVPRDQFILGGRAWQMCRAGEAQPQQFGVMDFHGMSFVLGNLVRDLASLNKLEMLPWDTWGILRKGERQLLDSETSLLGKVAELTQADDSRFEEVLALYGNNELLRVPAAMGGSEEEG